MLSHALSHVLHPSPLQGKEGVHFRKTKIELIEDGFIQDSGLKALSYQASGRTAITGAGCKVGGEGEGLGHASGRTVAGSSPCRWVLGSRTETQHRPCVLMRP